MDDLLGEFLAETSENLEIIDTELVQFETNPQDGEMLNNIFRLVHTVKGTAGFLDLSRLESVAHAGEALLGRFRDGELEVTPEAVTLVLACIDQIKFIRDQLEAEGAEPTGDDSSLIGQLEAMVQGGSVAESETAAELPVQPREVSGQGQKVQGSASPRAHSIRVNVDILEQLMMRVSELVLIRNQLLQMLRNTGESEFKLPLQRLSGITAELQETVMKTRMQPIGSVWAKLPRIVRDAARELGKSIDLQLEGEQTELDRQVLEQIKDPLTHMIRNACDHAIEPPEEREAAGKSPMGRICLSAWHEGGHILIRLSDDGRGLDTEKIRETAIRKGLVDSETLAAMNENQLHEMIFAPGFSTVSKVTNFSGRGVGMDVVKTNIELMGGSIDLAAESGCGASFTIKIPLTMTIISSLIVGTCDERLALPQLSVLELVRIGSSSDHKVERINRALVLRLRDYLLPVVPLAELLGMRDCTDREEELDKGFVVVMQVGPKRFGLLVEDIFDTEEIVVKPLSKMLGTRFEYSGATILGDGKVILILDPNGLARAGASIGEEAGIGDGLPGQEEEADKAKNMDMLLFRSGSEAPRACLLELVTRLEALDVGCIAMSQMGLVAKYRGHLMPLLGISDMSAIAGDQSVPIIVFGQGDQAVGLVVEEILDIIEEPLHIELESTQAGLLGTAMLKGEATEVIDVGWYLEQARPNWSGEVDRFRQKRGEKTVLLIESHPFFRALLQPLLKAAGYEVVLADNTEEARSFLEEEVRFDAVLADIDKGEDTEALSEIESKSQVPLLVLSGRDSGGSEAVSKTNREELLTRLDKVIMKRMDAA